MALEDGTSLIGNPKPRGRFIMKPFFPDAYQWQVTIFDDSYKLLSHMSTSMSYPNLVTKYIFHRVSARVGVAPHTVLFLVR